MTGNLEQLDFYYNRLYSQILQHQSLTHGLFPLHINDKLRKDGHVRDNVYCAMSIWALALAYRNVDDDNGRTYELESSAVKCMRGILFFYMRQAHRIEAFKKDQQEIHSVYCKFDVHTAMEYPDSENYHNLQIDAVALFLLTLVQMTTSGLCIIFTSDEVNFIQNLVYYIERTYRIADYGMWERGTRYNVGSRELNSSSIGMCIAALEAINGFNLFGNKGTISSVIYTDPDAHYRNTNILRSLLPRESNSKAVDASLLTIVGFPAFAINDPALRSETKEQGRFGLKRFKRDGFGTVVEDQSRKYYEPSELQQFENIECEWPMMLLYLALEAIFVGKQKGEEYMDKLEPLFTFSKHGKSIPKYYYVAKDDINLEREMPGEAVRWPNNDLDNTFLWGNSLLIITELLVENLVTVHDLDPIHRSMHGQFTYNHIQFTNLRYSSLQAGGSDPVVQVCLMSENRTLQAHLATYGIETQTPKEIEPIIIVPPNDLVRVFENLGKNEKLQLSGRPQRPLGSLGTSKIYRILGKTVVTYPILLDEKEFYMTLDMSLLIADLKNSLAFLNKSWNMRGRPTVIFFLRDHNFCGVHASEMVDFMSELKSGEIDGVKVKLGKLQTFMSTCVIEHLDYLKPQYSSISILNNTEDSIYITPAGFESTYHPIIEPNDEFHDHSVIIADDAKNLSRQELIHLLDKTTHLATRMFLLQIVAEREGIAYTIDDSSVEDLIDDTYKKACYYHNWSVVRRGASLLNKTVPSLSPSITTMLVNGKLVNIGVFGEKEHVISTPLTPAAIKDIIYDICMRYDQREVSLQQEMVIYLANIMSTKPQLFKGMLSIRVGWIIEAMKKHLLTCGMTTEANLKSCLYKLSPNEVQQLVAITLSGTGVFHDVDLTPRNILEKRYLEGALGKVSSGFHKKVWYILERSPGLKVHHHLLPQQPLLTETTAAETDFKLRVEEMLQASTSPAYRQILVELMVVMATILQRNPEIQIQQVVDLPSLVENAIDLYLKENIDQVSDDFFMLDTSKQNGTMSYLARSIVNNILNNSLLLREDVDQSCSIS